jgi:hypothetical protein
VQAESKSDVVAMARIPKNGSIGADFAFFNKFSELILALVFNTTDVKHLLKWGVSLVRI